MMNILFALCCSLPHAGADSSFPQATISNGIIHARIYLPDTANGYYRGSRFDWAGVVPELECEGHSYAGQWFERYAPTINDAIMGPVESFDPLGYEEAGPGGGFVMIGVGLLARPDAAHYSPFRYYTPLNPGKWAVHSSAGKIEFEHELNDTAYSYDYHKTLQLVKGKPELLITHSLKNTGKRSIETNVYDHNLWILDRRPVGPGLAIRFPFSLTATEQRGMGPVSATVEGQQGAIAIIKDSQILFLRKPVTRESAYAVLGGYEGNAAGYVINMENSKTGAGLRMVCDRPLSRLVFWSSSTIACPEPYIRVKIGPGEVFNWTITYTFYTLPTKEEAK